MKRRLAAPSGARQHNARRPLAPARAAVPRDSHSWLGSTAIKADARIAARRASAAATELAVCLPVLTLIVFGSIQACNLIYLKHGVVTAAYEGTLELSKRNATSSSILARAQQVLSARGIKASQIKILPEGTEISAQTPGTPFSVEVTATVKTNMSLSGFFPLPSSVTGRIAATR